MPWHHILQAPSDVDKSTPAADDVLIWDDSVDLWVPKLASSFANAVYMGNPNTDGSWRLIPVGSNLSVQKRESGTWVEKGQFNP
jgi:hypothetical protein